MLPAFLWSPPTLQPTLFLQGVPSMLILFCIVCIVFFPYSVHTPHSPGSHTYFMHHLKARMFKAPSSHWSLSSVHSGTHYSCPLVYPTGVLNISCILFLVLHRSQVLPPPFFPLHLADHHVLLIVAFRNTNSFLSISPAHPPKHTTPPDVLSFNSFLYCTCNMPFKKSNNT